METFYGKAQRMKDCCTMWETETYIEQKVKVLRKTNLCRDKWCENCKAMLAAWRKDKWAPVIMSIEGKIGHLVLTVPRVGKGKLGSEVKQLLKNYRTLVRHLRLERSIEGIENPLEGLGVEGSVRALEVTYNGVSFHPHIHAIIAMKGEIGEKTVVNCFSSDNRGRGIRQFSAVEVYLQKLWFLIVSGERVCKANFEVAGPGYSVILDMADSSAVDELCKYTTKGTSTQGAPLEYETFVELYNALYGVRIIQGYGCWFGLKDEEAADLDERNEVVICTLDELKKLSEGVIAQESIYAISELEGWRILTRAKYHAELMNGNVEGEIMNE